MFIFCIFILAYSFGAFEALATILRIADLNKWSQRTTNTTRIYLILVALIVLVDTLVNVSRFGINNDWLLLLLMVGVPLLVFVHMWRSRQQGPRRWLYLSFMGSLYCFLWFNFLFIGYLVNQNGRFGLLLSWIASTLLLWAVIGEARCIARTSWPKTIWLLLISRLPDGRHKGHCQQCDYILFGLPEPRCPECGRPFTPDEAMPAAPHSR